MGRRYLPGGDTRTTVYFAPYPPYMVRGKGCHVWDVDGNEYLDFSMAVGPLSLGYCYPAVDEAIRAQLEHGITFSLMHPLEVEVAGRQVIGFPALVDAGDGVRLTAFDTEDKAREEHRKGLARLFALQLKAQVQSIEKLPDLRAMALQYMALGTEQALREQIVAATLERTCLMDPLPVDEQGFAARRDAAKGRILLVAQEIVRLAATILAEQAAVQKKLAAAQKGLLHLGGEVDNPAPAGQVEPQLFAVAFHGVSPKPWQLGGNSGLV